MHISSPMPAAPADLNQCSPHTGVTGADARQAIAGWADLSPTQRRDWTSAISMVGKWLGFPAGDHLLSPTTLRHGVLTRSAANLQIGASRLSNIRGYLGHVMQRLDLIDDPDAVISVPWSSMLAPIDARARALLDTLARFCDREGLLPHQVDETVLDALEARLTERSLRPRPRKFVGEVRGCWNKAAKHIPGWPPPLAARRPDARQFTLPLTHFSPAFQQAVAAFGKELARTPLDALDAEDELFDDEAPLPKSRALRPISAANRMDHVRYAASALQKTGVPIDEIRGLADLVQPLSHAKDILSYLYRRGGKKPSSTGHHVSHVLSMIARHHVGLQQADLDKLKTWGKAVRLTYRGMTEKNERTVREALTPERKEILLAMPAGLMEAARKTLQGNSKSAPRSAVTLAMQALLIEILTKLPMRQRNIRELRLDTHLHRGNLKNGLVTHIDVPLDEVKNARALSLPVSAETSAMMAEWLRDYRPHVAPTGSVYLFPGFGERSKPITPQGLRDTIKSATREYLGVAVTPHQFRHIAAHVYLTQFPGEYGLVAQLLGHKSVATTYRSYAGIEQQSAIRQFDDVVNGRLAM